MGNSVSVNSESDQTNTGQKDVPDSASASSILCGSGVPKSQDHSLTDKIDCNTETWTRVHEKTLYSLIQNQHI